MSEAEKKCRVLTLAETLRRISAAAGAEGGSVDAAPASAGAAPGILPAAGAAAPAIDMDGPWEDAGAALRAAPQWAAEAGAARRPRDGALLLWFAPGEGRAETFPSRFVMDVGGPASRRRALSTWDSGKKCFTGSEIFTGSPVIGGPPFDGKALIVAVRAINTPFG